MNAVSVRRLGPVVGATFASQALGALSLVALTSLGLTVSDRYAIGIQVGNASMAGLVYGVVYLLAIGRPWFNGWRTWAGTCAVFAVSLPIVVVAASAASSSKFSESFALILGLFGLGGVFLSWTALLGVRAACDGRPFWLAACTIPSNLTLLAGTGGAHLLDGNARELLPAAAWSIGAALSLAYLISKPAVWKQRAALAARPTEPNDTSRLHTVALLIGVVTSAVLPPMYFTAAATLSGGAATAMILITRIGSSFVNIGVNSLLMVRYNWRETSVISGRVSGRICFVAAALLALGLLAGSADSKIFSYALITGGWAGLIIAAPIVMRELNAQRRSQFVLFKTLIDLLVSSALTVWLFGHPSISGIFGIIGASQATTMTVCGVALRNRTLTVSASVALVLCAALVLVGQ